MLEHSDPARPSAKTAPSARYRCLRRGARQEARADRAASGEFQSGPRRPMVRAQRLSPRHPQAALRRGAARRRWRDHCGAVIFGGPDERQRQGRVRSHGDRLDQRGAGGEGAVPRHLPRRADAGRALRRQGRLRSARIAPRSAITRSLQRKREARSALPRPCLSMAPRGLRAAAAARGCSRHRTARSPIRRLPMAASAVGVQFHPEITYRAGATAGRATTTRAWR